MCWGIVKRTPATSPQPISTRFIYSHSRFPTSIYHIRNAVREEKKPLVKFQFRSTVERKTIFSRKKKKKKEVNFIHIIFAFGSKEEKKRKYFCNRHAVHKTQLILNYLIISKFTNINKKEENFVKAQNDREREASRSRAIKLISKVIQMVNWEVCVCAPAKPSHHVFVRFSKFFQDQFWHLLRFFIQEGRKKLEEEKKNRN